MFDNPPNECPEGHVGNLVQLWNYPHKLVTDKYRCLECASNGNIKWIYSTDELLKYQENKRNVKMRKVATIEFQWTHANSIIEFRISAVPKRGYWKEHIQPTLDLMKAKIPITAREFNPNTQKWSIGAEYWPACKTLFELMNFALVEEKLTSAADIPGVNVPQDYAENFYYTPEPEKTVESTASIAEKLSAFLGVTITTQDLKDLKKLYRAKALELHPDRGGDAAKMSELNRLWTLYTAGGVQ